MLPTVMSPVTTDGFATLTLKLLEDGSYPVAVAVIFIVYCPAAVKLPVSLPVLPPSLMIERSTFVEFPAVTS